MAKQGNRQNNNDFRTLVVEQNERLGDKLEEVVHLMEHMLDAVIRHLQLAKRVEKLEKKLELVEKPYSIRN